MHIVETPLILVRVEIRIPVASWPQSQTSTKIKFQRTCFRRLVEAHRYEILPFDASKQFFHIPWHIRLADRLLLVCQRPIAILDKKRPSSHDIHSTPAKVNCHSVCYVWHRISRLTILK